MSDETLTPNLNPRPQASPPPSTGGAQWWLVMLSRLLLLGLGVTTSWLAGIVIAQLYPTQPSAQPPLQEVVLRRSNRFLQRLQRMGTYWQNDPFVHPKTAVDPTVSEAPKPLETATVPSTPTLSKEERQAANEELADLQVAVETLIDRTTTLEKTVGPTHPTLPLETRLQGLAQRLSDNNQRPPGETTTSDTPNDTSDSIPGSTPDSSTTASTPTTSPPPTTTTLPTGDPLFQAQTLKVTFPSDIFFPQGQPFIPESGRQLLNTIIGDLNNYPGATILITAHTTGQDSATANRDLAFKQASAIYAYLYPLLGDNYHWVVVGYGDSQPLTPNTSATARQRNRRIEIAIDPR